jgi:hypothetical protein
VLTKQVVPTVGYADEDVFLPQWAIAGIVIGLASLLFVIIFGVTVVSNRLILLWPMLTGLNLPTQRQDNSDNLSKLFINMPPESKIRVS